MLFIVVECGLNVEFNYVLREKLIISLSRNYAYLQRLGPISV